MQKKNIKKQSKIQNGNIYYHNYYILSEFSERI